MAKRKCPVPAKKRARNQAGGAPSAPASSEPVFGGNAATAPRSASNPIFAEPQLMPDPTQFKTAHASDSAAYNDLDKLKKIQQFNPLPFRPVQGVAEPILKLAAAYGSSGANVEAAIVQAKQIVFHSAGDTGATIAKQAFQDEYDVVDKLIADFDEKDPAAVPRFFYHLGDVVYSFGEHVYYYDQFYDAFRNYPAPVFAIPGNHDGLVTPVAPQAGSAGNPSPGDPSLSLSAFYANFCAPDFQHSSDAVSISRTTMIQPGVYFTLEAPQENREFWSFVESLQSAK